MKKVLKIIVIVLVLLLVAGGAVGGFFLHRYNTMYIGRDEALRIAAKDAGVELSALRDRDVDFDVEHGSAWYEVGFDVDGMEYEYSLDAITGEILYSCSEPWYS